MAHSPPLKRAARSEWVVLSLLLSAACTVLGLGNGLGRPDATLYDFLLTSSNRAPPPDIAVIAIDDRSLAAIGRWPWSRDVHTRLLDRLAGAKPRAIGLDLILTEPEPGADAALSRAIGRLPTVLPVLADPVTTDSGREFRPKIPIAPLAGAAAGLGHIQMPVDVDGIARNVYLHEGLFLSTPNRQTWPQFALAMLMIGDPAWRTATPPGTRNPVAPAAGRWARDFEVRIPFPGASGRVERISYIDVLDGSVPAGRFDGKYVLVGATAAGLGDAFPTPMSGDGPLTPGVEIHAHVLDSLRSGTTIRLAHPLGNAAFNLAPLLLVMVCLRRLSPRRALAATAVALAGLPILSLLALKAGIWFSPAAGMLCVAIAYPLWSWRRLEASLRFLGEEFLRLAAEPRVLPGPENQPAQGIDIVERRMLALADAAGRLRNLRRFVSDTLEGLPESALVADHAGVVLIANHACALLFDAKSSEDLRGRAVADLLSQLGGRGDADPAPDWESLKALAGGSATGTGELRPSLECRDRHDHSLLARCARLDDAGTGATGGWIVVFADISELRAAERTREEVLAFLSHDMRSPQSSIIALIELHELDPDDNPKEEVHKRIEQYARRTLSLSEQFLQLARAETKTHEPAVEDLGEIAEEAVDDVWTAASQKSIRLDLRWDGEPVPVLADRPLLLRAIINLLTNAVKYSPGETTVTIEVAVREVDGRPMHVCAVADQGYGMSEENQARLFERFRRFSEPGQPTAHGAGLGMAFVKTVVEKHGGGIGVISKSGQGSTFTLFLPSVAA